MDWECETMQDFLRTEKLTFSYIDQLSENRVLKGIDLDIKQGDFVVILGHNGSGKSTLAKHFNAILLPTGGTVYVKGWDTKDESKIYDIRQNVGMVFQNPDNQIVATIVEEDVAFALENLGVEPSLIRKKVDEALAVVGMSDYKLHEPHKLSGGQKQRVAIAGIIAMQPDCIVLDEPTAMLDPKGRREVIDTLKKLKAEYGITIVLITHYMNEATEADRVVVMDNGNIILDGTPKEVFSNVSLIKSVGLDVPQATELCYELTKCGINLPNDVLNADECIDALAKLLC